MQICIFDCPLPPSGSFAHFSGTTLKALKMRLTPSYELKYPFTTFGDFNVKLYYVFLESHFGMGKMSTTVKPCT